MHARLHTFSCLCGTSGVCTTKLHSPYTVFLDPHMPGAVSSSMHVAGHTLLSHRQQCWILLQLHSSAVCGSGNAFHAGAAADADKALPLVCRGTCAEHFNGAIADLQQADIQSAASQVKHQHYLQAKHANCKSASGTPSCCASPMTVQVTCLLPDSAWDDAMR